MGAPQVIVVCLFTMGFTLNAIKHGQSRARDKYSVWAYMLRIVVWAGLLWWGGFFTNA